MWTEDLQTLKEQYETGSPFSHCIIPNFFDQETIQKLEQTFPTTENKHWHIYNNPIEKKFALNDFSKIPIYDELVKFLQSDHVLNILKQITGIDNLENDPYLHGAGIHYHPTNAKLDVHLDYSIHPISRKERRINLIIYLNESWKDEWEGALELWSGTTNPEKCVKKILPQQNTAVIFKTNDISLHGLPKPLKCPEGEGRKSFAIYYVSPQTPGIINRPKAFFFPLPDQPMNDGLRALYDIRKERRIEEEDISTHFPGWELDPIGKGHWYN